MKSSLPPTTTESVALSADLLEDLLEDLLAAGRSMQNALERGRLERFFELLDERSALLDDLFASRHPSDITAEGKVRASELAAQHDALMEAAVAQQQRMEDSLNRIEQVKAARRSYSASPGRSSILDENLRV